MSQETFSIHGSEYWFITNAEARDARYKELTDAGQKCVRWTLPNQLYAGCNAPVYMIDVKDN